MGVLFYSTNKIQAIGFLSKTQYNVQNKILTPFCILCFSFGVIALKSSSFLETFDSQKMLSHPISPFLLISFLLVCLPMRSLTSSTSCHPYTCNGLTVKKPFWIPGLQESHCGRPGFNISCHENKPLITISGDVFLIINISYRDASLQLAKSDVFDSSIKCPTPQHNFSIRGTQFSYGPATTDLFFLYNCTNPLHEETYAVNCGNNYSFAVFHLELLQHWNYSISWCWAWVNHPVETDNIKNLLKMNYTDILKKGFVLQWNGRKSGNEINLGREIWIGAGAGAAAVTVVITCILFFVYHRRYKRRQAISSVESSVSSLYPMEKDLQKAGIHIFDYHELEEATNHFDPKRELGDGGYGAVYKGKLRDGRIVAVKRLYENHYRRVEQFMNEIKILTRLRHQHLVSLYGCTSSKDRELLLVYEYISNGTLADHLHAGTLQWITRLNIAVEIASALAYLHASGVIHRDIKSTNILLDANFGVKVADLGLSRLCPTEATHVSTAPQGTPGYVDPEYHECYQLSEKSDVYSFGVVLMELISSQPAIDITRHRHEINLSTMAVNKIQSGALAELVDPCLGFEWDDRVRRAVIDVAEVGFRCLQGEKEMRPGMQDVLEGLQGIQRNMIYSTTIHTPPSSLSFPTDC